MSGIRVLLVDDHTILRQGIKALMEREPDIAIIGEAGDGLEAVRLARQLQPDVVVMDVQLPGLPGPQATRAIRQACPRTGVLVLTMHDSSYTVFGMLKAGARGYLLKESAGSDLADAIRTVHRGQSVLHPTIARMVIEQINQVDLPSADDDELSPREQEIFRLIAAGKTSREIAEKLGLSAKTIDNCRARILQKLHARNKAEAITIGVQRGLIHLSPP